eukprot:CAMPEP_0119367742 /NCGR_PEP_ID=MMETSP1334-20130426/14490_1 /TAXON_ID=127549 /ORGANISM="Calcidiscus leptoporus, Strain RCC1130" /LENGTH=267 /DNA_ID=CAMNT_0007384217 /DNA_START=66 /DNA_END=869 /DNA_ORIENTATION=+
MKKLPSVLCLLTIIGAGAARGEMERSLLFASSPYIGYEWIGVFAAANSSLTWSVQKKEVGGTYAAPTMKLVLAAASLPTEQTAEDAANDLLRSLPTVRSCSRIQPGDKIQVGPEAQCYDLEFDNNSDVSSFFIQTSGEAGLVCASEYKPMKLERGRSYIMDSDGVDIEPIAEKQLGTSNDVTCKCESRQATGQFYRRDDLAGGNRIKCSNETRYCREDAACVAAGSFKYGHWSDGCKQCEATTTLPTSVTGVAAVGVAPLGVSGYNC